MSTFIQSNVLTSRLLVECRYRVISVWKAASQRWERKLNTRPNIPAVWLSSSVHTLWACCWSSLRGRVAVSSTVGRVTGTLLTQASLKQGLRVFWKLQNGKSYLGIIMDITTLTQEQPFFCKRTFPPSELQATLVCGQQVAAYLRFEFLLNGLLPRLYLANIQ